MNKQEFLTMLESYLSDFKEEERKEILYDYEEHFRIGEEKGKSAEELIRELGDPRDIANQYKFSNNEIELDEMKNIAEKAKRTFTASFIIAMALLLFNLIFVSGIYFGLAGTIIGLFAAAIGITIAGFGMTIGTLLINVFPQYVHIPAGVPHLAIILLGIGTISLGLLFIIGMSYIAKYFVIVTIKYAKWNMKVIKG